MSKARITWSVPENATPEQIIEGIAANINDQQIAESTAVNYVIRCLVLLGHTRAPEVSRGQIEGATVRLYTWDTRMLGKVVLAVGPTRYLPKFVPASALLQTPEQGRIYSALEPDSSKTAQKAEKYSGWLGQQAGAKAARKVAESTPAPAPPTPSAPAKAARVRKAAAPTPVAPPPPPPPSASTDEAEKAELMGFLGKLLG